MKSKYTIRYVLALDSIYGFLDLYDRHLLHLFLLDRLCVGFTTQIEFAITLVESANWRPPEVSYGQDRVLYFTNSNGDLKPIKYYQHEIEIIIKEHLKPI